MDPRPEKRPFTLVLLTLAVLAFGVPAAVAEDAPPPADPAMEAMIRAATPGEPHSHLAATVGRWDMTLKAWNDPSKPEPEVMTGTAERRMTLGGRVLEETVRSEYQGMPFEGLGMTGYDNVTGKYWSTWSDNMSTGLFVSWGTADESGVVTLWGEMVDPVTGTAKKVRGVSSQTASGELFEMYESVPGGTDRKTMEIVYTRAK